MDVRALRLVARVAVAVAGLVCASLLSGSVASAAGAAPARAPARNPFALAAERYTLPSGMTITDVNTVIVAEVFFNFTPMFNLPLVPASQLYHTAFFRPRLGDLDSLN